MSMPGAYLKIIKSTEITDEQSGPDYNICCYGVMTIDRETSTAIISSS
jgi:hypothetical protein